MNHLKISYFLFLVTLLSSCSLLEFSVNTGVEPLETKDLNTRVAIRSFNNDLANKVVKAADSINNISQSKEIHENAILWKINATSISTQAAYQTVPEIALVESWIMTEQMYNFFNDTANHDIFETHNTIALNTSANLLEKVNRIADNLYNRNEYKQRLEFVEEYAKNNPFTSLNFTATSIMEPYLDYLEIDDTAYISTVGSSAEVMNDMSERITALSTQTQVQIQWQKELFILNNNTDSIAENVLAKMDSFAILANDMMTFAQSSPEMMNAFLIEFQQIMLPLMDNMNSNISQSIKELSNEREHFQTFVNEQRELAINELNTTGDQLIETTLQNITLMLKQLSWLIIILVLVLTLVLFGLPFFLGYQFARLKSKITKKQ